MKAIKLKFSKQTISKLDTSQMSSIEGGAITVPIISRNSCFFCVQSLGGGICKSDMLK